MKGLVILYSCQETCVLSFLLWRLKRSVLVQQAAVTRVPVKTAVSQTVIGKCFSDIILNIVLFTIARKILFLVFYRTIVGDEADYCLTELSSASNSPPGSGVSSPEGRDQSQFAGMTKGEKMLTSDKV